MVAEWKIFLSRVSIRRINNNIIDSLYIWRASPSRALTSPPDVHPYLALNGKQLVIYHWVVNKHREAPASSSSVELCKERWRQSRLSIACIQSVSQAQSTNELKPWGGLSLSYCSGLDIPSTDFLWDDTLRHLIVQCGKSSFCYSFIFISLEPYWPLRCRQPILRCSKCIY